MIYTTSIIIKDDGAIKSFLCPKCGTQMTDAAFEFLEELTGIPATTFKNGQGLAELTIKLQVAELTLSKSAIKLDQSLIAEKVLENVESILSNRLAKEEREHYQGQLDIIKDALNQEQRINSEKIRSLEEQLRTQKQANNELEKELITAIGRQQNIPSIKGGKAEVTLATRIRSIAPFDEAKLTQRHQGSTDILYIVKENNKTIIDKICVESKDVEKWDDKFIKEAKAHGDKEGTDNIIIATKAMPPDVLNTTLDCFRDDVWIVPMNLAEFAYMAYRQILISEYKVKTEFDRKIKTIQKEKSAIEKLKVLSSKETFVRYSELAMSIHDEVDSIDEESRLIINYIQARAKKFKTVATNIRKLVNDLIEHNQEIQERIATAFNTTD